MLSDLKQLYLGNTNNNNTPLDLIMNYYSQNGILELEKYKYNTKLYNKLNWSSYTHFDVISSFWTIFASIISFEHKGFVAVKSKYSSMYNSSIYSNSIYNKINTICNDYQDIVTISNHCHTVANFMPCPSSIFNITKGCLADVKDFFPLMIDKIQNCIDNKSYIQYIIQDQQTKKTKQIIVNLNTIEVWHSFFLKNRNKLCLTMYYSIDDNSHLLGKKFFKSQSLRKPLPSTVSEIHECTKNMVSCISERSVALLDSIK